MHHFYIQQQYCVVPVLCLCLGRIGVWDNRQAGPCMGRCMGGGGGGGGVGGGDGGGGDDLVSDRIFPSN